MPISFASEVEAFLSSHPIGATDFGVRAVGDGRFVGTLRRGRDPRLSTVERVRSFMAEFGREAPAAAPGAEG